MVSSLGNPSHLHSSARISLRMTALVYIRIANAVTVRIMVATPTANTVWCMSSGLSKFGVCPGGGSIAGMLARLKDAMVGFVRLSNSAKRQSDVRSTGFAVSEIGPHCRSKTGVILETKTRIWGARGDKEEMKSRIRARGIWETPEDDATRWRFGGFLRDTIEDWCARWGFIFLARPNVDHSRWRATISGAGRRSQPACSIGSLRTHWPRRAWGSTAPKSPS